MPLEIYPQSDFVASGGLIACDSLELEIQTALPLPAPQLDAFPLVSIQNNAGSTAVEIIAVLSFDAALSAGEKATLDGVIATHDGVELPQLPAVGAIGYSILPPTAPETVVIGAIGTFVDAPGTYVASALTSNLSMPVSGVIRYNGPAATLALRTSVSVGTLVAALTDISIRFTQNGSEVPNSQAVGSLPNILDFFLPATSFVTVDAVDGDEFRVQIANLSNTNNLALRGVRFGVEG